MGRLPLSPEILILAVIGYVTQLIVRRLFLSPLAAIPGPRLAALTYWYECFYDIARPAQFAFKIKALHERYGPVVRIGPNDISISDPGFVDAIYAPGPGRRRDKNPKNNRALGVNSSVGGSVAHDLHHGRREALNPFFSPQRIHQLDPDLSRKVVQVESLFAQAQETGEVLNLSDVYFAFCNDVVHQYCFGSDPNLVGDMHLANARRVNVASVLGRVKVNFHFPWIRQLMSILPPRPTAQGMVLFRRHIRAKINEVLSRTSQPRLDGEDDETPSIFVHLRDSEGLPAAEKSPQRLEDEAVLMTMAGTYSPMLSLVVAQYHLLARPDVMARLRAELAENPSASTAAQLERLPYLSAVALEAHRLTFGLTGRNPRLCPDETIVYNNNNNNNNNNNSRPHDRHRPAHYSFPPGTSLSVSTLVIHTDESLFLSPWTFDPDRWLVGGTTASGDELSGGRQEEQQQSEDEQIRRGGAEARLLLARRRRAMLSFMRGPRICIGLHLASAEMAVLVAAMARWDLKLFETDEADVSFKHDYHVMSPRLGSKGVRVKVKGRCTA